MRGEEFSRRLEQLSDDTMRMISNLHMKDRERFLQAIQLIKTTEDEAKLRKMIQALLNEVE